MSQNLNLQKEPDVRPKKDAFPYQREAVDSIKCLEYSGIFHEQGLGKTKIAIDVLLFWLSRKIIDSVIVVTKKGLVPNWIREIKQHTHMAPKVIGQNGKSNYYAFNSPSRLYLAHYEAIFSEKERIKLFQKSRNTAIILDESQKIKNPESRLAKTFHELSLGFKRRMVLTGTPVANRTFDIWSQIFFLDNGLSLGNDYDGFRRDFDLPDVDVITDNELQEYEERLSALFKRISLFTVRETKAGSGLSLPSKEYITHKAEWETLQEEMYLTYRNELAATVVKEGIPLEDNAEALLKRILRLIQIASNPHVVDEAYDKLPGKFQTLETILAGIVASKEKAIVWTSFTENAEWIKRKLAYLGSVRVHGKMNMEEREKSLTKFMTKDDCRVLVATPGAAKEGLTLTMANHVIFYDRTFSLDDYLQAQDRIHRISQTKTCFVHCICLPESVDEWIDAIIEAKHWSAKLAQGDVSLEQYKMNIDYGFPRIMKQILGLQPGE